MPAYSLQTDVAPVKDWVDTQDIDSDQKKYYPSLRTQECPKCGANYGKVINAGLKSQGHCPNCGYREPCC